MLRSAASIISRAGGDGGCLLSVRGCKRRSTEGDGETLDDDPTLNCSTRIISPGMRRSTFDVQDAPNRWTLSTVISSEQGVVEEERRFLPRVVKVHHAENGPGDRRWEVSTEYATPSEERPGSRTVLTEAVEAPRSASVQRCILRQATHPRCPSSTTSRVRIRFAHPQTSNPCSALHAFLAPSTT